MSSTLVCSETCSTCLLGGLALLTRSQKQKKDEHRHEWLFLALAHGRKDITVKGDPDMNWNDPHPHFGTPLHAIGGRGIQLEVDGHPSYHWTPESTECIKDLLALFEFAIKRGADPTVACPLTCTGSVKFAVKGGRSVPLYDLTEHIGGRSAISLWLALSQRARELDNSTPEQLPLASAFFDGVLSLLLHVVPKHKGFASDCLSSRGLPAMVEVPKATAGMWQSTMLSEDRHDVILRCVDGDVGVHSAVLACTSKVLSAMLSWPHDDDDLQQGACIAQPDSMQSRRVLPLQDQRATVELWRCLIYTGLPPTKEEDLSTELLLDVLDLSHRWQDHLLQCGLLSTALARRVADSASCESVLNAAIARDLPELRGECLAFARRSREMRRDWELGSFTGEVSKQLDAIFGVAGARRGGVGTASQGGSWRWDF